MTEHNRYSTFGDRSQFGQATSSQNAYYGGSSAQDRMLENLNRAQSLLEEPETLSYMDGYNLGFGQQPQRVGTG